MNTIDGYVKKSDAIYNMEIMDDFNYMHHIMTGD